METTNHLAPIMGNFPIGLMLKLAFGGMGLMFGFLWIKSKQERGHFDEAERKDMPATHVLKTGFEVYIFVMVMMCVFAALALGADMIESMILMPH